ncbi:MAG: ATP-binding protein [Ignavibacteria bacterium]|nr:ATP-binding protein [Ignavibacteria bacterium]
MFVGTVYTVSQEEQGYTRKYEGNGLGLALVKKYCEINNADIKVESQKGKGTTFTVIFN